MNSLSRRPETAGKHVLVADDTQSARHILRSILEGEGFSVSEAIDGSDAIFMVRDHPELFDLILMDLVMDHVDGIDAIREIRPLLARRTCPIVAMSATTDPSLVESLQAAGADAHILQKPFRRDDVIRTALSALGISKPDYKSDGQGAQGRLTTVEIPSVPGCRISDALERCGENRGLYRSLLSTFRDACPVAFQKLDNAIDSNDVQTALRLLHKLRGEVLNLGIESIVTKIEALESILRSPSNRNRGKATRELVKLNPNSASSSTVIDQLLLATDLRASVDRISSTILGIPALSRKNLPSSDSVAYMHSSNPPRKLNSLLELIQQYDVSVLDFLSEPGRILPDHYLKGRRRFSEAT